MGTLKQMIDKMDNSDAQSINEEKNPPIFSLSLGSISSTMTTVSIDEKVKEIEIPKETIETKGTKEEPKEPHIVKTSRIDLRLVIQHQI